VQRRKLADRVHGTEIAARLDLVCSFFKHPNVAYIFGLMSKAAEMRKQHFPHLSPASFAV
jgi:hypothetical protein